MLAEDDPAYELPPGGAVAGELPQEGAQILPGAPQGAGRNARVPGGEAGRLTDVHGIRGQVEQIVRKLLDGQGWLRWASLSSSATSFGRGRPRGVP